MGDGRKRFVLCLERWQVNACDWVDDFPAWQVDRFERQATDLLAQAGVAEAYVYLIQFQKPLGTQRHAARFYLGATTDLVTRLTEHCKSRSRGSNIVHSAISKRIPCDLVLIIPFERKKDAFTWESAQKKKRKCCHQKLLKCCQ